MPKGALMSGFEKPSPFAATTGKGAGRAILGAKSGLFELQGVTGESDKVR